MKLTEILLAAHWAWPGLRHLPVLRAAFASATRRTRKTWPDTRVLPSVVWTRVSSRSSTTTVGCRLKYHSWLWLTKSGTISAHRTIILVIVDLVEQMVNFFSFFFFLENNFSDFSDFFHFFFSLSLSFFFILVNLSELNSIIFLFISVVIEHLLLTFAFVFLTFDWIQYVDE